MGGPVGNQYWKFRKKHGRDRIFKSPDELLNKAIEYFNWVDENPLKKSEVVKYKEHAELMEVPVCRPYTKEGLADFCEVYSYRTITEYKERGEGFSKVLTYIESRIYNQKFENAAAGLLQHNIIARDLGLVDKKDFDHTIQRNSVNELFPEDDELCQD